MTMQCHESKRRLDLFLDGELALEQNMEVLQHLNLCRPCSAIYEGEKELRSLLKDHRVAAPADLRARIERRLRSSARWWRLAPAAAALFLVSLVLLFLPGSPDLEAVAGAAVRVHETRALGMCVTCEKGVDKYYDETAGYQPCVHDMSQGGFQWRTASCSPDVIRGRMVCWLVHENASGARVSQASFPVEAVGPMEGRLRVLHVDGRVVIVSNCGKMLCVFVADDARTGRQVEALLAAR